MKSFRNIDDIQKDKIEKEHQEMKEKAIVDTVDIIKGVKDRIKKQNTIKKKGILNILFRIFITISALIFCLNLILVNVWVLRWVFNSLFSGW